MKIIAFILSIIVFSMSFMPCNDGALNDKEHNHELSEKHDHSNDEEDSCTPFCICQCCGMTMILPQVEAPILRKSEPIFAYNFHYKFNYSFHHPTAIWHPPTA